MHTRSAGRLTSPQAREGRGDIAGIRAFVLVGFALVATQRIGLLNGAMPIAAILTPGAVIWSLTTRRLRVSGPRVLLFLAFVAVGALSALLNPGSASILSLIQVAVLWLAIILERTQQSANFAKALLTGAASATLLAAVFGLFQAVLGVRGHAFLDPLGLLPTSIKIHGYVTTYGVGVPGSWDKANGGLFLEPSFLSLFCALFGVVVLKGDVWPRLRGVGKIVVVALYLGGMLASAAISGIVLFPVLGISLLRNWRQALGVVSLCAVATPLLLSQPILQAFLLRLNSGGSNNARLTRPYAELLPTAFQSGPVLGLGPGSVGDAAKRLTAGAWQQEVTAPTAVKLLYEYGMVGFILLAAIIVLVTLSSDLSWTTRASVVVVLVVPTNGLSSALLAPLATMVLAASASVSPKSLTNDAGPLLFGGGASRPDLRVGTPLGNRREPSVM